MKRLWQLICSFVSRFAGKGSASTSATPITPPWQTDLPLTEETNIPTITSVVHFVSMDVEKAIDDLGRDEGWVPYAYRDNSRGLGFEGQPGYLTIGYGFLIDPEKDGNIPREVGDFWLRWEIEDRYATLKREIPWIIDHPEPVQRALLNMSYQMGIQGLLGFHNTLREIRARNYEAAAISALTSRWASQTPSRAERVIDLIRSGS